MRSDGTEWDSVGSITAKSRVKERPRATPYFIALESIAQMGWRGIVWIIQHHCDASFRCMSYPHTTHHTQHKEHMEHVNSTYKTYTPHRIHTTHTTNTTHTIHASQIQCTKHTHNTNAIHTTHTAHTHKHTYTHMHKLHTTSGVATNPSARRSRYCSNANVVPLMSC